MVFNIRPILLGAAALVALALPEAGLCAGPGAKGNKTVLQGVHGDRTVMPKSCRACHRGMAMGVSGEERVCLDCHGGSQAREQMVPRGYYKPTGSTSLADIEAELRKPYSHPVLTVKGVHRQKEALPEEMVNAARHSECIDCHNPHLVEKGRPFRGIAGRRVGNFIADIQKEYELCYKCHAASANLPAGATSKADELRLTNPSFHPIEGEGKNAYVISLKEPYAARQQLPGEISVISCSDCHGSDDPSGPKGPHGSVYRGLLVANYEMDDGRPESEHAYALCYKCHNRTSILGNESFPYHARHIEGGGADRRGTSCFTCHDAHGSTVYQFLIRFNEDVVRPAADGKLEFKARGVASRHGTCTLNCHGVEHNARGY
jgi:hypothetical protein